VGDKQDPCVNVMSSVSFLLSVSHVIFMEHIFEQVCVRFVNCVISGVTAS
jgi:hypothetical protein